MEIEFQDLLSSKGFHTIGGCNLDSRDYNRAYVLKCDKCGKLFVRSHKQLRKGMLDECSCYSIYEGIEIFKAFKIQKYQGYVIIESIESIAGKKNDFVIISPEDLDFVLSLLENEENTSIQSIWLRNKFTSKLFGSYIGLYHKNCVEFDFRRDNVVITHDIEEDKVANFYLDKEHKLRSHYNITKRYCDSEGFNHGIVYHVTDVYLPDEDGKYNRNDSSRRKLFYFKSDIAAARMTYRIEKKYFHNEKLGLDAYNIMTDYSGVDNTDLFLKLMKLEADNSYVEYIMLTELADVNPLAIFRYGMEDVLISYGIPCTVYFDMYPFDDKHVRGRDRSHRKNDIYILKWGRFDSDSKLKPKELIRCIVGKAGKIDYDLYKVNGTLDKMSFQQAYEKYGSMRCDYNDANGVFEKYTKEIVGYEPRHVDKSSIKTNNDDKLKQFNSLFNKAGGK